MGEPGPAILFHRVVTPTGIVILRDDSGTPWPDHLAVSRLLIEDADPRYLTAGDGMLRFRLDCGCDVLYGLAHPASVPDVDHYDLIRR
jgi:hypothetical protein